MIMNKHLIGPINTGLENDLRPFMIPDDAYARLRNAYVFRGRTRKRFGGILMGNTDSVNQQLLSRLRIMVDTTDDTGASSGTIPGAVPLTQVGEAFSIGTEIFTVYEFGTPGIMLTTGASTTHTFNTTNGDFVFAGATPSTAVYYYPALPVMGLCNYEKGPVDDQPSIAFDTQFAYIFSGNSWSRVGVGTLPVWHGDDEQFFWTTNYLGIDPGEVALFVSNFNATIGTPGGSDDPIWAYINTQDPTWINFSPLTYFNSAGAYVQTAQIIVVFKNHLVLLNTIENDAAMPTTNTAFPQRCRYSGAQVSPFAAGAWLQVNTTFSGATYSGGGFIDAATEEEIVSAEFIKDRLIVFFERSTWELVYTGNQIQPFNWQKINTELGSESTFSTVPFDKEIFAIGNTGIHSCSGANVQRIDNKIPDDVFRIKTDSGDIARVYGIRDYYVECVYWTFPTENQTETQKYPNRVLLYNYANGSWAYNDDTITAFGYFEQETDFTWESMGNITWENADFTWNSGIQQAQSRQVLAGNQEGFLFLVQPDIARNAPSLQITNLTISAPDTVLIVAINHNLVSGEYVLLETLGGITGLSDLIFEVQDIVDADSFTIDVTDITFSGTYTGGGTLARVSRIDIITKQYNFYLNQDRNVYIQKVNFCVDKTSAGAVTVDYYPSSTELSMIDAGTGSGSIMGTGVLETSPYDLYPLEQEQNFLWHPVYFQSDGEFIQLRIYLSDEQMIDNDAALSDFTIESFIIYSQPTTMRLQ